MNSILVPAQGFEPWTIGLKVGLSDVRRVPPDPFKTHSVFKIAFQLFSPFRRVSRKSVLVAALTAALLAPTADRAATYMLGESCN